MRGRLTLRLTALLLLFSVPLFAGGPMLIVDSFTGAPPVQLSLRAELCSITDQKVRFSGFLMDPGGGRFPEPVPVIIEVPRAAATLHKMNREGDYWSLNLDTLRVSGRTDSSASSTLFVGRAADRPFSVSVTDDPTGLEVLAVLAGAAVVICGTVYVYSALTRDECIANAERACGKGNFTLAPPTFGIVIKNEGEVDFGCQAICTFSCYGSLSSANTSTSEGK